MKQFDVRKWDVKDFGFAHSEYIAQKSVCANIKIRSL